MDQFDDFIKDVLKQVRALAVGNLSHLAEQLASDTRSFIDDSEEKLTRWADLMARGKIDPDEFAFLLESQKDLLKMTALRVAGVQILTLRRLKEKIIGIVVDAAIGRFLP